MSWLISLLTPVLGKFAPYLKYLGFAAVILAACFGTWHYTGKYKDAIWSNKLAEIEKAALEQKTLELEAVNNALIASQRKATDIEKEYHNASNDIKELRSRNNILSAKLGGLRDPYYRPAPGTGAAGNTTCETTGGQLSAEASGFLLKIAQQADEAATYAMTCYNWINRNRDDD